MADELSPVKRALIEIRELRARLAALETAQPIAIVGMGLRMPGGVKDAATMTRLLWSGVDAVGPIPSDRWDLNSLFDADPDAVGRMITREGGFLDGIDRFDADFFGISPREAASMDPQQRLLLEVCWHALEDAGYANAALEGSRTGVYMGVSNSDYARMVWQRRELIDAYCASGTAFSVLAGRVSYCLGLRGPSLAVDTACSSSLVALHLACGALRGGECDMALAGGINLILSPEFNIAFTKARMMAPDGRCKTFDAAADGYVRGEGVGVLVLKRLDDALAAGDRIAAVVHGSAVNQDGSSNGLTAPNGPAQEAVIRAALAQGGIAPADVSYVEAHGTGTPLGDPIEVGALAAVFAGSRERATPLLIGSVKTHVGHLEAAAGVAGIIKVILSLERRSIPANLHFNTGNPRIEWDVLPIDVPRVTTAWQARPARPARPQARLAGVSSFGFSGTNAHAVLGEAPVRSAAAPRLPPPAGMFVLPLSARDDESLRELAGRYAGWFDEAGFADGGTLADACFTAGVGRKHFRHRLTASGATAKALASGLTAFAAGAESAPRVLHGVTEVGSAPKVGFFFVGELPPSPGFVDELYDTAPAFRRALDACAAMLQPRFDLRAQLQGALPDADPLWVRPACVAVEYALAALWQSWGVEPDAVVGHGVGEISAARCAGVRSLREALTWAAAGEPSELRAVPADRAAHSPSRSLLSPAPRDAALAALRAQGVSAVIEIGPQTVTHLLQRLQQLYVAGASIDWHGFAADCGRRRVALPLYPFRGRRYWIEPAPAPANPWVRVAASLDRHSNLGPVDLNALAYPAIWESLERLTVGHAVMILKEAGLFMAAGETRSIDEVLAVAGIGADHRRLIGRWLSRLCATGLLARDGNSFVAAAALPTPDLEALWTDAQRRLGGNPQLLAYLKNCGALLSGVLRGSVSPLETLFPGGSFALARELYERSATMRYINALAAQALETFVHASSWPLAVMEVGAGSGATSASLLPVLGESASYLFTDVSPFFLDQARARFVGASAASVAKLAFRLFDMDRDPAEQGFEDGAFDLIVSANAVHASADLPLVLSRLRRLLAPGGALMLVESTTDFAWFDMSTGLIEGWQHFTDASRQDQPLLSAPQWLDALTAAGFVGARAWPPSDAPAALLGQHVVIGQAAGIGAHVGSTAGSTAGSAARRPIDAPHATEDAPGDTPHGAAAAALRQKIAAALPDERDDLLRDFVRREVMQVLRRPADDPPGLQDPLMDLGIDSLMAVQLRGQLGSGLGLPQLLPATLMFDHPTIAALAQVLAGYLDRATRDGSVPPDVVVAAAAAATVPAAAAAPVAVPAAPPEPASQAAAARGAATASPLDILEADDVAALSDAQIEALVLARLQETMT
jgi:3-oxoacyl-(acyl-carrier-protein) synthase/SAM-dependent methyltransferase